MIFAILLAGMIAASATADAFPNFPDSYLSDSYLSDSHSSDLYSSGSHSSDSVTIRNGDASPTRYVANPARRLNPGDGRICDWSGYAFHPVGGSAGAAISFQYDDDYLYVAVAVDWDEASPAATNALSDDRLWLIIRSDADSNDADRYAPSDIVLMIGAPGSDGGYESAEGVLADGADVLRNAIDKQALAGLQSRVVETGQAVRHHAARSDLGFVVEVEIPRANSDEMMLQFIREHRDGWSALSEGWPFAVVAMD